MKITIILLAFVAGLLIGEYRGCPKDKYSLEYGCENWTSVDDFPYLESVKKTYIGL